MRKVIVVDATFLKTVYGGQLVFATAQDPNRHHYPFDFGVIDAEKDVSWRWFLENLKIVIPNYPELVFLSNRNSSIIKSVREVYPRSQHGHCIWHLSQNVRKNVNNLSKDSDVSKFTDLAHIYTQAEFDREYADFRIRYPQAAEYLDQTIEVEKWSRAYFKGDKYNLYTSNAAESLNSTFKKARKYYLLPLIDDILEKFSDWFNRHRKEAGFAAETKKLVPVVENELHTRCVIATHLEAIEINSFRLDYYVIGLDGKTYLVDLLKKSCSCRTLDIDKYPCVHAISATILQVKNLGRTGNISIYDLCSRYYLIETWEMAYYRTLYLVPHESKWSVPPDIQGLVALPPDYTKTPGRIQEKRFSSGGERRRRRTNNRSNHGINFENWLQPESG